MNSNELAATESPAATLPRFALRRFDPARRHHHTTVIFTVRGEDLVTAYTYSTWSDYTSKIPMTKEEGRAAWKQLLADGFKPGPVDLAA